MDQTLLCLGFGFTARALARRLAPDGWRIAGTFRRPEQAGVLTADGVEAVSWVDGAIDTAALKRANAVLVSTPPTRAGCPSFANVGERLAEHAGKLSWIGYLSSNGVYGDHEGRWVDEDAFLHPSTERGRARIAAEAQWAAHAAQWSLPLVIFRLPGVYGVGRSAIETVREGRARRIFKKDQIFNRMHVDDIAAALAASIAKPGAGDLFNLADDLPAPPQDVVEYACELLGVAPPPLVPIEEADLTDMALSFYADNKRVMNARMKQALGVRLQYPTYKEGLRAILEQSRHA